MTRFFTGFSNFLLRPKHEILALAMLEPSMKQPIVKDRVTGEVFEERVYGSSMLRILYPNCFIFKLLAFPLVQLVARLPLFSWLYGCMQKRSSSKKKIEPFIKSYHVNIQEVKKTSEQYESFDDFFTRKLIPSSRACEGDLIIPADGRYQVLESIDNDLMFNVKGSFLSLKKLTKSQKLADRYAGGSLVIARLAPPDYHRFHFPCTGTMMKPKRLRGPLFSVNPRAIKARPRILVKNKRMLSEIDSPIYGKILFIEVGATCVGTIHQTFYDRHRAQFDELGAMAADIGEEKGYFSFGGSCILLLFEPGKVNFCEDLIIPKGEEASYEEVLCRFGQKLGASPNNS